MNKNKKTALLPRLRFPEFSGFEEWKKKELKNIAEVIMGSSPSSSSYNENKIGLPLLQGNADIKNRLSAPRIYTTEVTKECEIDDILISVRAPVGAVAKSLHKACIGRGISAIRANNESSKEYLYQWLFSYESSWLKISQGGIFDAVNRDDIRNLLLPIPQLEEQQKIADCLSSLDELISAEDKKLEALKAHKKGLMQKLFPSKGKTVPEWRFPEFRESGEWNEKKLGSKSIKVGSGSTPLGGENNYKRAGRPFIRSQNVGWGCLILDDIVFIDESTHQGLSSTEVHSGDVFLNITGASIGRSAVADCRVDGGNLNQHVCIIRTKADELNPYFLNHYLLSVYGQKQIKTFQAGGNRLGLNFAQIRSFSVPIPSVIEEQQKIADCLSSIDDLITEQTKRIEMLKQHKKGLMQGLFPSIEEVGE